MKLGKLAKRNDPRNLKLERYLTQLPELPPAADWSQGLVSFGEMGNADVGDCTCATLGHALQIWSVNAGNEITVPDADVLALYSAVSGYDPADPSTDQGAVLLDVLKYVRSVGDRQGIGGHRIDAFMAVNPKNHDHVKASVHLLGGVAIGVDFLHGWENADVWSIPNGHSAGGHAIWGCAYTPEGLIVISWGRKYLIPWSSLDAQCDEAYALVSPDWIGPDGIAPSAFDLPALQAAVAAVAG
jgi:hypothetical protein